MDTARPPNQAGGWLIHKGAATVVVLACFAMSAVGLYGYGRDALALHPVIAALIPVGVDLLAICGMYASYAMRNARWHIRAYSWLVFGVTVVLSMAANMAHAAELNRPAVGVVGAMFPPLLLAFAVHLLIVTRRERDRQDREWASTEATAAAAREAAGVPVSGLGAHLPACVYHAHSDDDSVIYTGSTTDLPTRIRKHRTNSSWFDEVARWSFTAYESITVAQAEEKAAIRRDRPRHNDHHNPVRPPRRKERVEQSAPQAGAARPRRQIPALKRASAEVIRDARATEPGATQKRVVEMTGVPLRSVARYWPVTTPLADVPPPSPPPASGARSPVNGGAPHGP